MLQRGDNPFLTNFPFDASLAGVFGKDVAHAADIKTKQPPEGGCFS
jgi:hypothetical protein